MTLICKECHRIYLSWILSTNSNTIFIFTQFKDSTLLCSWTSSNHRIRPLDLCVCIISEQLFLFKFIIIIHFVLRAQFFIDFVCICPKYFCLASKKTLFLFKWNNSCHLIMHIFNFYHFRLLFSVCNLDLALAIQRQLIQMF